MLIDNYWDDFETRTINTVATIKNNKRPNLSRLTVHLTEGCNFRCSYCNMDFSKKMRTMSEGTARMIVNEYANMGGKTIHFTGGEPSIVSYIETLLRLAKDRGLTTSMNTNAFHRIDTTHIDKLKTSFDFHDASKADISNGVGNSFSKVVENMKIYSVEMKNKSCMSITAVLDKNTFRDMTKLATFVRQNFSVYNLYFSNYKGSDPKSVFSTTEIELLFGIYIPATLAFFKSVGDEYSYKQLSLYKPSDFEYRPDRFKQNLTIPCYIQWSEMTIDVDGSCHNCSHNFRDGYKPYKVNVKDKTLNDCFIDLKTYMVGNDTNISEHCLTGCNCNLMGFNKSVHNKLVEKDV